ncbi:MAG TPA: 4a-hydroxytetrahydrobiopterin dehydratase [Candidatus Polarisedimenticolaceae bacterium]|nr:4a-hydroxytetrahydrobiopterin dehydratase [Candidatus Polarisedimenticolaceae bacterium]
MEQRKGQEEKRKPALDAADLERMRPYAPAWLVKPRRGVPALHRTFTFGSFAEAMWFTLKLGEWAERDGQRPTILISWDRVTVALGSAASGGLDRRDFLAAGNVDRLFDGLLRSKRPTGAAGV